MKKIFLTILAFSFFGVVLAQPAVPISPKPVFTPEQEAAIQTIIHKYLVTNPEVLIEASKALQQKQMAKAEANAKKATIANADIIIRDKNSPVVGNKNGTVTMIAFFDYNCPYCRALAPVVKELIDSNPNLRVVFKEWPIHGAPAIYAAKAALAANLQGKYFDIHQAMMTSQKAMDQKEVLVVAKSVGLNITALKKAMQAPWIKQEIDQNQSLAQKLSLVGTPSFIIVKTDMTAAKPSTVEFAPGVVPKEALQHMIDQVS